MLVTVSSSARIGFSGSAPICCIQEGTPCPSPATKRPGYSRASVAISIAAATGLRKTTGMTPSPTVIRSVTASAVAAAETPPARKQSSHTQSSSNPPGLGGARERGQLLGRALRREDDAEPRQGLRHGIAQMRDPHTGDDRRIPEDGRCVREVVEQPHACA